MPRRMTRTPARRIATSIPSGDAVEKWSRAQMRIEELEDAATVLFRRDLHGLIVLGGGDDPEFLRLPRVAEQGAGHVGLDVGVVRPVDHENWPMAKSPQGCLHVR